MTLPYLKAPKPVDWLKARITACLNVVQAAELLGVDPSTWRGWEAGRHTGPRFGLNHFVHLVEIGAHRKPKEEVAA